MEDKSNKLRQCPHCNEILERIWFTAEMTEEWSFNGKGYFECTARHSLPVDPHMNVLCPECHKVCGTGVDFGF